MKKVKLLNIYIDNLLPSELLEQLKSGIVFTPNVDHIIKLQKDHDFIMLIILLITNYVTVKY